MDPKLLRTSLSNSVYFSVLSFIIILGTSALYNALEKTTGSISMGAAIIIALSLILILFFLGVTSILLAEPKKGYAGFWPRALAVLIFLILSSLIIAVLAFLFWYRI